jgi:hypothetical protein
MDNRRYARPTSRDSRRIDDAIDVEPPGTEVEIVELSAPAPRRPPSPNTIWAAIVVVGLIGFAAGFAWPRDSSGDPAASGIPVAGASQPVTGQTPGASEGTPTGPPSARPSPRPTRTPGPAEWRPYDLNMSTDTEILDVVSFDGQFVMPVRTYDSDGQQAYSLLESMTGQAWTPTPVPAAIRELQAGAVIDGRLWFIARVEGVSQATFELISTDARGDWQSLGPTEGLGIESGGAVLLARVADRWIVSTYQYDTDGGLERQDVRTSSDGVTWSNADVPKDPEEGMHGSFSIDGTLGLLGVTNDDTDPSSFVLTTRDGKQWTRADLEPETNGHIYDVRCTEVVCLGLGTREEVGAYLPTIATSSNGTDWVPVESDDLPELSTVTVVPGGFLGLDGRSRTAWVSSDGIDWQGVVVIPDDTGAHYVFRLAANQEFVAAIGARDGGSSLVSWAGTLDALPR